MAKVRGPLHSMDLRGRMADGVVFGDWKGIPWMRTFVMPSQPRTQRREQIWRIIPQITRAWADLTDEERAGWEAYSVQNKPLNPTLGRKGNWTGCDAYVSANQVLADAGLPLTRTPPAIPFPNPPTNFRLTSPSPGTVRVTWNPLPIGILMDLWHLETKASRKVYPYKFRHLAFVDGTAGVYEFTGIRSGLRVGVKGRVVRADGGRSGYAQGEIVV